MKSIVARISSSSVPGGRVSSLKQTPQGAEQAVKGKCVACDKKFWYIDTTHTVGAIIEQLACSHQCAREAGFFPLVRKYEPIVKNGKSDKPPVCPDCEGPSTRGRGYRHKEDCPKLAPKKTKPPCESCGGPARGRGWMHKKDCSKTLPRIDSQK